MSERVEFMPTDCGLCEQIASEFFTESLDESARMWWILAGKVSAQLAGEPVVFAWRDVQLIASLHVATVKSAGYTARSHELARLGLAVTAAWLGLMDLTRELART